LTVCYPGWVANATMAHHQEAYGMPPDDALWLRPKHVEVWRNILKIICASSWFFFTRINLQSEILGAKTDYVGTMLTWYLGFVKAWHNHFALCVPSELNRSEWNKGKDWMQQKLLYKSSVSVGRYTEVLQCKAFLFESERQEPSHSLWHQHVLCLLYLPKYSASQICLLCDLQCSGNTRAELV